jgi:hypothetical protein
MVLRRPLGKLINLSAELILFTTLFTGCNVSGSPSGDVNIHLSFTDPPILNRPVQLTATFSLVEDYLQPNATNVFARIILPEGFEKTSGDLEWRGDFIRGKEYNLIAVVKAVKTGNWEVAAQADFSPREGSYPGGIKILYVSVSEQNATISEARPNPKSVFTAAPGSPPPGYTPPASVTQPSPMKTLPPNKPVEPYQIPSPSLPTPKTTNAPTGDVFNFLFTRGISPNWRI